MRLLPVPLQVRTNNGAQQIVYSLELRFVQTSILAECKHRVESLFHRCNCLESWCDAFHYALPTMALKVPKVGTIFELLILSIPLYLFLIAPFISAYFPSIVGEGPSSSSSYQSFEKTESLIIPDPNLTCDPSKYNVRILSREPLVVYIEGFLQTDEADHLIDIAYARRATH